ncbi:hypothetical protein JCM3770_006777 [Rhodotorula araucariae]
MADPPAGAPASAEAQQPAAVVPTKLFSIFAPQSRPAAASSSSASGSTCTGAAPAPAPPDGKRCAPPRGGARSASASQLGAAEPGNETETLSLVDDSDDDNLEEEAVRRTGRAMGARRMRERAVESRDDSGDDDDAVVVVVAGRARDGRSSIKVKGKAILAPPKQAKDKGGRTARRSAPSTSLAASASDTDDSANTASASSALPTPRRRALRRSGRNGGTTPAVAVEPADVVDLTKSPPRKKATRGADRRAKKRANEAEAEQQQQVGTPGHAFSSERRTARDRAKRLEALEARWPSAEEHAGGVGPVPLGAPRGEWDARWVPRDVKGKARAVDPVDDQAGSDFLAQYAAVFDFPATRGAPDSHTSSTTGEVHTRRGYPSLSRRPRAAVPFLVPHFAPHALLDRLAEPLRAPAPISDAAFARPGDPARARSEDDGRLWCARYAPQRADEVLGAVSGQSAVWLREWLEELKVQGDAGAKAGKRRRPVARGLVKPKKKKVKKRKALDDFIASSDDDDGGNSVGGMPSSAYASYASDPDDDELDDVVPSTLGSAPARRAGSVFPTLTNLILLQGPHGSGKSATVHAVAHELGFEVFEVFAGMGRRGARDLERYVGDVGRNHVVLGGSPRKGVGGIAAMFGAQAKKTSASASASVGAKGNGKAAMDWPGDAGGGDKGNSEEDKAPTQSLILVDEVDVLFSHEEDFWQGLIALAQQSRRPIVMTCTDSSRIPFDDLGLQQIVPNPSASPSNFLSFAAPEPLVAVPYLQLVALREGHILPASTVSMLYTAFSRSRPYPAWLTTQQPGVRPLPHPLSSAPLPSDDLRKALMQLQAECGWGVGGCASAEGWLDAGAAGETRWSERTLHVPPDEVEVEGEGLAAGAPVGDADDAFERAVRAADALSFADASIARRIAVLIEEEDTGRFTMPGDAEDTFPILEHNVREETRRFPFVGAEPAMVGAIDSLAHAVWGASLRFGEREDEELENKRADLTFHLGQLVHSGGDRALLQSPGPLLPSAVVTTDYRPYIRAITLADDARLAASTVASASAVDDGGPSELHALGMAAALAAGPAGARKTRKSARQKAQQGKPMYERALDWASEAEAQWLRDSGVGE